MFTYEAGSINTIVIIVDRNSGITVIPKMAIDYLAEAQKRNVKPFRGTPPVREMSLVTCKDFLRDQVLKIIINEAKESVPSSFLDEKLKKHCIDI